MKLILRIGLILFLISSTVSCAVNGRTGVTPTGFAKKSSSSDHGVSLSHSGHASQPAAEKTGDPQLFIATTSDTSTNPQAEGDKNPSEDPWERPEYKSYLIPAAEIVGFDFSLNQYDRRVLNDPAYHSNFSSLWHNLKGGWEIDHDPFAINQIGHPYQGSMYYGFARSAGLNYWESMGYSMGGSVLWEEAGETSRPSINDQVASGIAGSFFGEALFRIAEAVLEGSDDTPDFLRELGAGVISPPTGFNRLAFGEKFNGIFPSHAPAIFGTLRLGGAITDHVFDEGVSETVNREQFMADFAIAYGLPGKPGYKYDRPFDYFDFKGTLTSGAHNYIENVMISGLLYGTKYDIGDDYRGICGLYGSYDYISPQIFRISNTALSLGSTAQLRPLGRPLGIPLDSITLQGTALGGAGYGAAGTVAEAGIDRDYHYGAIPQVVLALRFLFGDMAILGMNLHQYYMFGDSTVSGTGDERISRAQAELTVRVFGHHGIGVQYVASTRDAAFSAMPDRHQKMGTLSLVYTYLSSTDLGAIDWKNSAVQ